MSDVFTVFEHSRTKGFDLTDRENDALQQLNTRLGVQVLRAEYKGELTAFQYVGIVRIGTRAIHILPKIYPPTSDDVTTEDHVKDATKNLFYLLSYANKLKIYEHDLADLLRSDKSWFELLIHFFSSNLLKEWQRGASRSYELIEDQLPFLRGKLQVREQLRHPARQHLFAITTDELSIDNQLNRIFRYVVERLHLVTFDEENRRRLGTLRRYMAGVTLLSNISRGDVKNVRLTRLNQQYGTLLNMALLFLDDGALQLSAGDCTSFAFVFDMNKLFESFMVNFIQRHREEILPDSLKACALFPQSTGLPFHLSTRDGVPVRKMKPDLLFADQDEGIYPLLLDLKYKKLESHISGADMNQMSAYVLATSQYALPSKCRKVLVLYPQTSEMAKPRYLQEKISGSEIPVIGATIDLRLNLEKPEGTSKLIADLRNVMGKEQ